MDDDWGVVRDANRLINEFGWYKGDYFQDWISDLIKKKTKSSDATFNDVYKQKQAGALVESGRIHTKKYFEWYDNLKNQPANRPL